MPDSRLPAHPPPHPALPAATRHGRGAASNQASARFDQPDRVADPELWDAEGEPPPLKTYVSLERPRTILTRNDSPDVPFDVSLNAYRGCEHGCAYCFARPSHAYLGLSPGLDFETRLTAKLEAPRLLAEALAKPGYTPSPIAMGTNTDPYQPIEKRFGLTRAVLEVLDAHGHPCTITTKNHLVTRDLDVLERLAARDLVVVNLSVTTLDPALARALEPRASAPHRRLAAIRALAQAGVPVNVFVSPLIPALNDHELEAILEAAAKAGARGASSIPLRLPHEVKDLFVQWLRVNRPDRAERVLGHVRAMRGGGLNEPRFGARMRGEGPYAALMRRRFEAACTRLGLARDRFALATQLFRPPPQAQGDLFG